MHSEPDVFECLTTISKQFGPNQLFVALVLKMTIFAPFEMDDVFVVAGTEARVRRWILVRKLFPVKAC